MLSYAKSQRSRPVLGPRSSAAGLTLRPAAERDMAFLARLYASTREQELAALPWTDAVKQAFLTQQFQAQHLHYTKYYSDADRLVVERDGVAIGRLYLDRQREEHRVIDIALLPEWRGQGYGLALMTDVLAEAAACGKPVRIHVEKNNPAKRLYARLGFAPIGETGVYDLLERRPEQIR
jgi:ribosomal protein S18 acetylase RimI-like enzyme